MRGGGNNVEKTLETSKHDSNLDKTKIESVLRLVDCTADWMSKVSWFSYKNVFIRDSLAHQVPIEHTSET